MALPPNTEVNETFLREVDENLRRDRARDFARKYGRWLVLGLVLFIAAAGAILYWKEHQRRQGEAQVEELAQIYRGIGEGKIAEAPARLDALAKDSGPAVRASALFTRAAIALEQNDRALAIRTFQAIHGDDSLPQPDRDAALIRQTAIEFDSLSPDVVINRLAPFARPGNPWYGSAAEMTALALVKQGKSAQAGRIFAALAADENVPQSLRSRSVQIAGSLGADASDALTQAR